MDGYALDKIRQELAPVDRLWRNVQSVTTFQGAGLVSFYANGDTSWWCLDCCLCLRLPISISRVTTAVIIGLPLQAMRGPRRSPGEMKVLHTRKKGQCVICKFWAVTAVIFARCWQASGFHCGGTSLMLLSFVMMVRYKHTKSSVGHSPSTAEMKGKWLQKEY